MAISSSVSTSETTFVCYPQALVYGKGSSERCGGQMQSHLDRPVGWTLSVSVGATARFTIGCPPEPGSMYDSYARHLPLPGQEPPGVQIEIHGGDALLFRGHRVFHSVDGMADNGSGHSPESWSDGVLSGQAVQEHCCPWSPARLAVLFRDQNGG